MPVKLIPKTFQYFIIFGFFLFNFCFNSGDWPPIMHCSQWYILERQLWTSHCENGVALINQSVNFNLQSTNSQNKGLAKHSCTKEEQTMLILPEQHEATVAENNRKSSWWEETLSRARVWTVCMRTFHQNVSWKDKWKLTKWRDLRHPQPVLSNAQNCHQKASTSISVDHWNKRERPSEIKPYFKVKKWPVHWRIYSTF